MTRRRWVVGIVDSHIHRYQGFYNSRFTDKEVSSYIPPKGQILFEIDITDEILSLCKPNRFIKEYGRNKEWSEKEIKDWLIKSNLSKCDDNRYYIRLYCHVDNKRIIRRFGSKSRVSEICKIWKSKYQYIPQFRKHQNFVSLRPICKFNVDEMYNYWCKKNKICLDNLGYVLVDVRCNQKWMCAILTKYIDSISDLPIELSYNSCSTYAQI